MKKVLLYILALIPIASISFAAKSALAMGFSDLTKQTNTEKEGGTESGGR